MHMKYIMVAATTLDGKIARNSNHPSDWTSPEDKDFMHAELDKCDVIIVGNKTYELVKKPLSKRNCIVFTRSIDRTKQQDDKLIYINPKSKSIQKFIEEKGYKRVCILGDAQVYGYFLEHSLIDEIWLTIEPIIFGSGISLFGPSTSSGSTLISNNEVDKKIETREYKLVTVKQLNQQGTVLLHYIKDLPSLPRRG